MADPRIYVFDLAEGRTIVVNATGVSLQHPSLGMDRLGALLLHLHARGHDALLRACAIEAAERTGPQGGGTRMLLDAARSAHGDDEALKAVRETYRGTAMAASAVGLPHGASNAATFLAAYAACMPQAVEAARQATRMAYLWAERSDGAPPPETLAMALLDWLLDRYPDDED